MPKKSTILFEFEDNPDKPIADSTKRAYKNHLNQLAVEGFKNKDQILNNAEKVVEAIRKIGTSQVKRNFLFASVFYAVGRLDLEKDTRGKPLFDAFQKNYKGEF